MSGTVNIGSDGIKITGSAKIVVDGRELQDGEVFQGAKVTKIDYKPDSPDEEIIVQIRDRES